MNLAALQHFRLERCLKNDFFIEYILGLLVSQWNVSKYDQTWKMISLQGGPSPHCSYDPSLASPSLLRLSLPCVTSKTPWLCPETVLPQTSQLSEALHFPVVSGYMPAGLI